jgi:hypothetical protein
MKKKSHPMLEAFVTLQIYILEFPLRFDDRMKQLIQDIEKQEMLHTVQDFQRDIYASSIYAEIKSLKIDENTLYEYFNTILYTSYLGFVEVESGLMSGLGVVIEKWKISQVGNF